MPEINSVPVVKATGLTKTFRDFWGRPKAKAVNDIDFEVREGEVLGLLGPNGSGKSTTVKMLLGLLYPSAGNLSIFGRSPRDVDTKKRIGYLPEETYLYKYLSAMETLDFFGALFNFSSEERKKRSEQLLDMVGLSHARRRPVGEFSKGMARRIGLAQAMINDPSFLILDEPTSGLDPLGCKEVKELILLLKKRGKTVLVTSHLLSDVEDVCDRVIILYGGSIRATGTLGELLTIPQESTITTPMLNPELTEKLLKILRENLKGEEFRVEHPRKTLEQFFLEVIDKARTEIANTSGVTSGGKIADYLSSGEREKSGTEILRKLTEKTVDASDDKKAPAAAEKIVREEKKAVAEKLTELLADENVKKAAPEEKAETPVFGNDRKDIDEANKKIQQLLGNK
ncbi:MAG: ABC transporter ATP-binding protein [Lentisphaerae bacterium GWF2_45_14]|nr:MAG: ABC transporter ATP-binding protein [Lentisphaerae bacterium GWF2_45_14]